MERGDQNERTIGLTFVSWMMKNFEQLTQSKDLLHFSPLPLDTSFKNIVVIDGH